MEWIRNPEMNGPCSAQWSCSCGDGGGGGGGGVEGMRRKKGCKYMYKTNILYFY